MRTKVLLVCLVIAVCVLALGRSGITVASEPDVVVDNRDPGFSTEGRWYVGDGGSSYNGDCAWAPRGIQFTAHVRPKLPAEGSYEVFGWWPGDPHHDQSDHTRVQLFSSHGVAAPYLVWVNFQQDVGRWVSLGTYPLGQDAVLEVDGNLNGNVVADAFRFVYRSPDRVVITPTPAPTPIPWSNHPPSPLEQLTSGDLSTRLGLVQRFYPYTPGTFVATSFDDCQAFPRDGCSGQRPGWQATVRYEDLTVNYRVSKDYRYVAIDAPQELARRQFGYLSGQRGNRTFRVDHYPDDVWGVSGTDTSRTSATFVPLDTGTLSRLRTYIQSYGTVRLAAPDGLQLTLYGLGARVELAPTDNAAFAALGAEVAAQAR
jgi:hypothetical protein